MDKSRVMITVGHLCKCFYSAEIRAKSWKFYFEWIWRKPSYNDICGIFAAELVVLIGKLMVNEVLASDSKLPL